ncbi:hypothetical protein [Acinetobacter sp.]|uniref:hypothetical protein n=1 Tax=Acinetobacter sp. TaxID=472 RepID=UPI000C0975EE|nr:hypothetical protein [Acinetobacter sp.]MAK31986.1 hypothetical protein [Acinetobacter sp.]|tara:strand:+ start:4003 stop:4275 length:273 start_codon:yes stop_codon:yes gene_type:complete
MDDRPWYVIVDKVTTEEVLAMEMINHGGNDWAFDVMNKRIERVSRLIQESWTEKQRSDRFTGKSYYEAGVPVIETLITGSTILRFIEDDQ